MIGSLTFIIVALRCTEKSTSSALARAIWFFRNAWSDATLSTVASTTSPSSTGRASRSSVTVPSVATWRMVSVSSALSTTDCSLSRKSSMPIVATLVLLSGLHAPIECGCLRA